MAGGRLKEVYPEKRMKYLIRVDTTLRRGIAVRIKAEGHE
jgi:hypothetical protein